jgi:hypothetical protein
MRKDFPCKYFVCVHGTDELEIHFGKRGAWTIAVVVTIMVIFTPAMWSMGGCMVTKTAPDGIYQATLPIGERG